MGKALVMGVALASNLGGMMSPISSPQNAFAIETMGDNAPSWRQWFTVAVPVAVLGVLICWLLLLLVYAPAAGGRRLKQLPQVHDAISYKQVVVSLVTVVTIVLWCLSHRLEPYLGNMGIIAIIPMAIFIGFGMLNKNDLRAISWDIILLAQVCLLLIYCTLCEVVVAAGYIMGFAVGDPAARHHLTHHSKRKISTHCSTHCCCCRHVMIHRVGWRWGRRSSHQGCCPASRRASLNWSMASQSGRSWRCFAR